MPKAPDTFYSSSPEMPESPQNRAFKYGDGVFETMCLRDGKIFSLEGHFERMQRGASILGMDWKADPAMESLETLIQTAGKPAFARIRMQLFRGGNGHYLPENNQGEWVAELHPEPNDPFIHGKEFSICLWERMRLQFNALSGIKHCNRLPWILAAKHAATKGFDDALIPGAFGFAESSASNLFIIKKNILETPGIETGCLPGIMRNRVMTLASRNGLKVNETVVEKEDLMNADEIFLTNAFRGILPVKAFLENKFPGKAGTVTQKLQSDLILSGSK